MSWLRLCRIHYGFHCADHVVHCPFNPLVCWRDSAARLDRKKDNRSRAVPSREMGVRHEYPVLDLYLRYGCFLLFPVHHAGRSREYELH